MACPRCSKQHSQDISFNFKEQKIRLQAQICQVCGYIWAEDEEQLRIIRKHLEWLGQNKEKLEKKYKN